MKVQKQTKNDNCNESFIRSFVRNASNPDVLAGLLTECPSVCDVVRVGGSAASMRRPTSKTR